MGEEGFMSLLAIVIGVTLVGCFLFLRLRLPQTAWARFESPRVVVAYYRTAVGVLSKNRWLLGLPVCFALANAVFQLGWMVPAWKRMASVADAGRFTGPPVLTQLNRALLQGFSSLNHGYFGAMGGSVLSYVAFLPCVVLFWVVCSRLGRYVEAERRPGLKFLEGTLKAALVVLVVTLVAMGMFRILDAPIAGVFSLGLWALSALWFCPLTLVEGVILFWARSALAGGGFDFRRQLNLSFDILKPLYAFNLLGFFLFSLPYVTLSVVSVLPWRELQTKVSWLMAGPLGYTDLLYTLYLDTLVVFFTVCAPFVLLWGRRGLLSMLKANFQFIGRHLVKYLTFVAVGGLLLCVPYLLSMGVSALAGQSSVAHLLFSASTGLLRTALSVVFFLALLKFFEERFPPAEPHIETNGPD